MTGWQSAFKSHGSYGIVLLGIRGWQLYKYIIWKLKLKANLISMFTKIVISKHHSSTVVIVLHTCLHKVYDIALYVTAAPHASVTPSVADL